LNWSFIFENMLRITTKLKVLWSESSLRSQIVNMMNMSSSTKAGGGPPHEPEDHPFKNFIQTDAETVFTLSQMDRSYLEHILPHRSKANKTFNLPTRYIHPKEFNYALPMDHVPEFAFVGRSNVGKSSLIATLLHSKNLVKISKAPGCTKSINYFAFAKRGANSMPDAKAISQGNASNGSGGGVVSGTGKRPELYLVDLPGYGFAKSNKADQKRWKAFIQSYLASRDMSTLRRVFVLVDSRHGLKGTDLEMMLQLNSLHLPYQIVLTKADSATKFDLYKTLYTCFEAIRKQKGTTTCVPYIFATSSKTEFGIPSLKDSMAEVLSHEWKVRERSMSSSSHLAESLLGQGPVDMSLAQATEYSPGAAPLHEEDDDDTAEERDLQRSLGSNGDLGAQGSTRLNVDDFKNILLAQGTEPELVKKLVAEYKSHLQR
jgi:GTP-binding protein